MRLLLLSNSRNPGGEFLAHAAGWLRDTLGDARQALFVPYAAVRLSPDDYAARVRAAFEPLGVAVVSAHEVDDPAGAANDAEAIVIGGGNTFVLLRALYGQGLIEPIRRRVTDGAPYVGWSAGANVACPTIRTTNDMPIVEPPSLAALGLVPFQINPHYANVETPGFGGETRDDRLLEFAKANAGLPCVGLPEGTALRVTGETAVERLGPHAVRLFEHGAEPREVADPDLSFLTVTGGW